MINSCLDYVRTGSNVITPQTDSGTLIILLLDAKSGIVAGGI